MGQVVEFLGAHYGVAVIVAPDVVESPVTGAFTAPTVEEACEVLAFLAGTTWRLEGGAYFFGARPDEVLSVLPAGRVEEADNVFGDDAAVYGGSLLFRNTEDRRAEIEKALAEVNRPDRLAMRVALLDVGSRDTAPVRQWMDAVGQAAVVAGTEGTEWAATLRLGSLVEFVDGLRESRVVLDTVVTIVDGGATKLQAGEIIEREVFDSVAADGGTQSFRTGFDRRPVGLELEVGARQALGVWFAEVVLADSSLEVGRERRTEFEGTVAVVGGLQLMASVGRVEESRERQRFSLLPFLTRGANTASNRQLILVAERIPSDQVPEEMAKAIFPPKGGETTSAGHEDEAPSSQDFRNSGRKSKRFRKY